ncbi:hypothetical protein [Nostoc parmelioides]|nr:hypothetical protein [Nostoc parmelioides]
MQNTLRVNTRDKLRERGSVSVRGASRREREGYANNQTLFVFNFEF